MAQNINSPEFTPAELQLKEKFIKILSPALLKGLAASVEELANEQEFSSLKNKKPLMLLRCGTGF